MGHEPFKLAAVLAQDLPLSPFSQLYLWARHHQRCLRGSLTRLYTGSDEFGESVRLVPGALTEPNNLGDTVTLHFPTFTETAEMAGFSCVLGGYHIQADNVAGLQLGRDVAREVFTFYERHVGSE